MHESVVTIGHRYRGPEGSANGGYACGLVAGALGGPVEVTLRRPPPLETPLRLRVGDDVAELLHRSDVVAEARRLDPALDVPAAPTFDEAVEAAKGVPAWGVGQFSECFVCGRRSDSSGLELRAGPVALRKEVVAAAWVADEASTEVVWASIDCPGAYAVSSPGRGELLLGRMCANVDRLPGDGERCVVVGWPLGEDGRKLHAGTALYGENGVPIAVARQVWIVPRTAPTSAV